MRAVCPYHRDGACAYTSVRILVPVDLAHPISQTLTIPYHTLDFLNKKHLKFDHGLELLIFSQEIEANTEKN